MKFYLILLGTLLATPAVAAPKYLTCSGVRDSLTWKLDLAVSEDQQIVTHHMNEAASFVRSEAFFTPTLVRWMNSPARGWINIFMVNRVTLEMAIVEQVGERTSTYNGTCKVAVPPKQAF